MRAASARALLRGICTCTCSFFEKARYHFPTQADLELNGIPLGVGCCIGSFVKIVALAVITKGIWLHPLKRLHLSEIQRNNPSILQNSATL